MKQKAAASIAMEFEMGTEDFAEASKAAQAGDASVFRAPKQEEQHGVLGAINDAWSFANNHKVETAGVALTAAAATAALVYFKPWKLLAGGAAETAASKLVGVNATERLVAAGMPITAETRAAAAAGLAGRGAATESLLLTGIPITAENRAAMMAATTLGLNVRDRAAALAATRVGMTAAGETGVTVATERLIASGIPITAENRSLAARGLLRHITGR